GRRRGGTAPGPLRGVARHARRRGPRRRPLPRGPPLRLGTPRAARHRYPPRPAHLRRQPPRDLTLMETLLVVDDPASWPISVPGLETMAARSYLTSPDALAGKRWRVINLCRSHRYQSTGYYVSLLAAARGHR